MVVPTGALSCLLAAALVFAGAQPAAGQTRRARDLAARRQEEIRRAIDQAVAFLSSQVDSEGRAAGEYPKSDRRRLFGGKTAICAYALLAAGAEPKRNAATDRAVEWLMHAKLNGVYPVAVRACALSLVKGTLAREHLAADVRWLLEAANGDGSYTYTHQGGRDGGVYDNSSSQIAVAGVWAGAARGIRAPMSYWRKVREHWLSQQQIDGGWGYRIPPRAVRTKSYGSMTAAGLATLYACFDALQVERDVRPAAGGDYEPVDKALGWLAKNYAADENPGRGVEWYYYWLFCVQRVGLASGYKYIGSADWYAGCVEELLRRRNEDGSWGAGRPADRVVPTAFALLFLSRGWHPVLFNKLQYAGKWNTRPRDLANLTRWLSYTFETPVGWQVVGLNSSLEDWHDAPIVYISGAGACELSEDQITKLRTFVLQGGTILSEAAGSSGAFTLDIRKVYEKLFPGRPLERLGDDHPIYSVHFAAERPVGLSGVSNGVRLLAVHSPRDLSRALQLGPEEQNLPEYQLLANVYQFATDRGVLRPRGTSLWPRAHDYTPKAVIRIARIKHDGNCDPEPLAWQRLGIILANRRGIRLEVSEPMPAAKLEAARWPVAAMTGTRAFALSEAEAKALGDYLADGGTLVADAAGGSGEFTESFAKQILPLVPGRSPEPIKHDHPIYKGLHTGRALYRLDLAQSLGPDSRRGRLRGVYEKDRLAIIYSGDDITAGLVGYPCYKLRGYTPETAVDLMINILTYCAAGKGALARP